MVAYALRALVNVLAKDAAPAETDPYLAEVFAARGGDRAAFGRLFRRYERMVHGVLLAKVRPNDAGDLVQDVFVIALERLEELREPHAFGGWLAQIARHRAIDFHRRKRATEPLDDQMPHHDVDLAEAERILNLIRELPEAYRETLVLRLVEGMTGPEIAAQVGLTPDSVRVNLHRGMKILRERIEGGAR